MNFFELHFILDHLGYKKDEEEHQSYLTVHEMDCSLDDNPSKGHLKFWDDQMCISDSGSGLIYGNIEIISPINEMDIEEIKLLKIAMREVAFKTSLIRDFICILANEADWENEIRKDKCYCLCDRCAQIKKLEEAMSMDIHNIEHEWEEDWLKQINSKTLNFLENIDSSDSCKKNNTYFSRLFIFRWWGLNIIYFLDIIVSSEVDSFERLWGVTKKSR